MKTHATFSALFLAFVCVVQPAAAQSATCESHDGRYRECRLPFSGTAQIERQLSSTSCEYGRTWGQRSSGRVWVSDGCRARFVPAGDWGQGSASGALLRCESSGGRRVCRSGAAGRMTIQRQLSKTTCVEGRNWGSYGNGEVWVDGGCRAEFAPAAGWQGGQYGSHYGSDDALLRCESSGRRQVCRSGVQGQLTLHRQPSALQNHLRGRAQLGQLRQWRGVGRRWLSCRVCSCLWRQQRLATEQRAQRALQQPR